MVRLSRLALSASLLVALSAAGSTVDASGPTTFVITVTCFTFQPEVVEVRSGDFVHFVHNDTCGDYPHTVTSSGSMLVAAIDLSKPQPTGLTGDCFDSPLEMQAFLRQATPVYEISLGLVGAVAARDRGQEGQDLCPGTNSLLVEEGSNEILGVIPYHCRLHGGNVEAGVGMRGALILRS